MKKIVVLFAVVLTASIVHAETMHMAGFELTPANGISIYLTPRGKISHIAIKSGVIGRNSANVITDVSGDNVQRDGGIVVGIGQVDIKRDSQHIVTSIGGIEIKREMNNRISAIGKAVITRNSAGIITGVKGDPRVRLWFELTEETD